LHVDDILTLGKHFGISNADAMQAFYPDDGKQQQIVYINKIAQRGYNNQENNVFGNCCGIVFRHKRFLKAH
jgi:hypothetical protein